MKIDNNEILLEAIELSEEALKDIELSRQPLSNIALKASRIGRIIGDSNMEQIMLYESSGYPGSKDMQNPGLPSEQWSIAKLSGRVSVNEKGEESANTSSVEEVALSIEVGKARLAVAIDPSISTSSTMHPRGNAVERGNISMSIKNNAKFLSDRKAYIYKYLKDTYYTLKMRDVTYSIFNQFKDETDSKIAKYMPEEVQKLTAIYDSLKDDNPEKWSNAMTSCRRMIKAVADKIFPATDEVRQKGKKTIELKDDNVINRLICFIEDNKSSPNYNKITLSNLKFIGERLDAVYTESSKGTHKGIISKKEAERCFMYTYMVIGDILMLLDGEDEDV